MSLWKQEFSIFGLALGFLTRIPMPASVTYSPEAFQRVCRYFAAVGWLIGLLLAFLWWLLNPWFGHSLTALLVLAASLRLTGAFHEDGLADTADGLGGGLDRAQKLRIMKDSRLGTYGAAALVVSLLLRWQLLLGLGELAPWTLLLASAWSRGFTVPLMRALPYCRADEESKVKPLVTRVENRDLAFGLVTLLPACLFFDLTFLGILVLSLFVLGLWLKRFYRRSLGGYTGDLLGAAQQMAEILVLSACYLMATHSLGITT